MDRSTLGRRLIVGNNALAAAYHQHSAALRCRPHCPQPTPAAPSPPPSPPSAVRSWMPLPPPTCSPTLPPSPPSPPPPPTSPPAPFAAPPLQCQSVAASRFASRVRVLCRCWYDVFVSAFDYDMNGPKHTLGTNTRHAARILGHKQHTRRSVQ